MIKASLHMGVYFWGRGTIDNGKRKSFPARPDFPILAFSDSCLRQTAISCENIQFFYARERYLWGAKDTHTHALAGKRKNTRTNASIKTTDDKGKGTRHTRKLAGKSNNNNAAVSLLF